METPYSCGLRFSEGIDTHRRPTKLHDKTLQLVLRKKETACFFFFCHLFMDSEMNIVLRSW